MSVIYVNGEFLAPPQAKISVFDRSFLFGEGLFESFRSYDSKIPFLKEHLRRLEWSATFLNLDYPSDVDFASVCQKLLTQNNLKEARFKIILSRHSSSATDTGGSSIKVRQREFQPNLVIICEAFDVASVPHSYKLKVITDQTNDSLPLAAMKTTNYFAKTLARYKALESGYDDGILLNAKGQVTETSSANIFWVDKDGKLWTISEEQGCLSGITKKSLMALLKEHKIFLKEGVIMPNELSSSKEVFITNSIIGIKPVVEVDKRQISGGETGSVTAMLMDLWGKHIKELTE